MAPRCSRPPTRRAAWTGPWTRSTGIIRDIRTAIFDLRAARAGGELAARVRAAATGMAADTDVEPVVRVSGGMDDMPDDLAVAVEAVVRVGVSNAVHHAAPSQICECR